MGSKILALQNKETVKHTYSIPGSSNALMEIVAFWFHPNFRRLLKT